MWSINVNRRFLKPIILLVNIVVVVVFVVVVVVNVVVVALLVVAGHIIFEWVGFAKSFSYPTQPLC